MSKVAGEKYQDGWKHRKPLTRIHVYLSQGLPALYDKRIADEFHSRRFWRTLYGSRESTSRSNKADVIDTVRLIAHNQTCSRVVTKYMKIQEHKRERYRIES